MMLLTKPRGLFLIWMAGALLTTAALAQTPFEIMIDRIQDAPLGSTVTVPVVKAGGSQEMWGFDFLITFDTTALTYTGADPGHMFDIPGPYEWERFESTLDTINGYAGNVRIVALANINDGPHMPLDVTVSDGDTLFTLTFGVVPDTAYNCNYVPIRFFWNDCSDNAIAPDSLGTVLDVSHHVYDHTGYEYMDISEPDSPMPTYFGAPDDCITDSSIERMIDFYNGAIDIQCIDNRGDVNCNGVGFEIADYIRYYDYFVLGLTAFGDYIDCAIDAADVNADGTGLRVEDLIYLYRVIISDAEPYPAVYAVVPHDSVAVTFVQDDDTKTISLGYTDTLVGINLVFDGEVTPTELIDVPGVISYHAYVDGFTRVLISPDLEFNCPGFVTGGVFLTYTGSALLVEAGAADCHDNVFSVTIERTGSGLTIPFAFEIGTIDTVPLGGTVSIPVIKTGGSIPVEGFDFLLAYDASALTITHVAPGVLFDIPGDFEWRHLAYSFGPYECNDPICPSGLVRIIGLADYGLDQALDTDIPNGTVLFTVAAEVTTDPTFESLFIPIRFFWTYCGNNAVAYWDTAGVNILSGLSDHVYDYNGLEMTDPDAGLPGYAGVPDSCIGGGVSPVRIIDLTNGGVHTGPIAEMRLIVDIGETIASTGDTNIAVDIHLSNPQDTIVGFTMLILLDRPDLVQFGRSPDDTTAIDVTNTRIEDWEFIEQQSLLGSYHDLKIVAVSNSTPPYDKGLPPGVDVVFFRLLLHAYDSLPPPEFDSTVHLIISDMPSNTNFSDPNGVAIGLEGGGYDFQVVSFQGGAITVKSLVYGDANGDGIVNVADAVFLIAYVFKNGLAPQPMIAGDVNCDGNVNVADAVYLVNFIFKGGPPPPPDGC